MDKVQELHRLSAELAQARIVAKGTSDAIIQPAVKRLWAALLECTKEEKERWEQEERDNTN